MTLSEEAKQAAAEIESEFPHPETSHDPDTMAGIIQSAIDSHERELLGMGDCKLTPQEFLSVIKCDADCYDRLCDYIHEKIGVRGNHGVYDDIDCATAELERLRKSHEEHERDLVEALKEFIKAEAESPFRNFRLWDAARMARIALARRGIQ